MAYKSATRDEIADAAAAQLQQDLTKVPFRRGFNQLVKTLRAGVRFMLDLGAEHPPEVVPGQRNNVTVINTPTTHDLHLPDFND